MNEKKKNQRRFARRSASSHVKISCHKKGPVESDVIAVVLDLSEAGARLLVKVPLAPGEEVVLRLEGPSYEIPLTRHGVVVWSFPVTATSHVVGVRLQEHLGSDDIREATIHPVRLDY